MRLLISEPPPSVDAAYLRALREAVTEDDVEDEEHRVRGGEDEAERLGDQTDGVTRGVRGCVSWTDIGRSMGVTKQAVRKRFVPKGPGDQSDLDPNQGFSRFTERARNVVMAAQNEAHAANNDVIRPEHLVVLELTFREALRMGHNYIGTEHILLALLELEDGTGTLAGLGVNKAMAEATIVAAVEAPVR